MQDEKYYVQFTTFKDDQENLIFFKELEIRRRNQRLVALSNCDTIARI
jgi:hypothetical protein